MRAGKGQSCWIVKGVFLDGDGAMRELLTIQFVEMPASAASACQCLGCGQRRPARMAEAYGSLTPKVEDIRDVATLASAG